MNGSQTKRGMGAISTIILIIILIIAGTVAFKLYGPGNGTQSAEMSEKQDEVKKSVRSEIILVKAMVENGIDKKQTLDKISDIKVDLFNAYENGSTEAISNFENFMGSILEIEDAVENDSEDLTVLIESFISEIDKTIEIDVSGEVKGESTEGYEVEVEEVMEGDKVMDDDSMESDDSVMEGESEVELE